MNCTLQRERRLRAAVIGTGFGTRIHVPGLRLAGVDVVALAGFDRERTEAAARHLGIPCAYHDYRRMLDDVRPELLCIATPPVLHLEMAREALFRGIHVICEKPLAMDAREAWEMADLAARTGVANAVDFEFRYWPARVRFRELVQRGYLGQLRLLRYVWTAGLRIDPANPGFNWFAEKDQGGGVLYNLASHFFDFVRWCFGEVASASAAMKAFVAERPLRDGRGFGRVTADDTASIELVLRDGALVTVQCSMVTAGRRIAIEAYGSAGTLILEDDRMLRAAAGTDAPFESIPVALPEPSEPKPLAPFTALVHDLIGHLRHGRPATFPNFADGARTQEVIDAVSKAADTGRWVTVSSRQLDRVVKST